MDMHIVVKKSSGRTWYAVDSGRFFHTNAPQFQATVDTLNKVNDGMLVFDILQYDPARRYMPGYIASVMRYAEDE